MERGHLLPNFEVVEKVFILRKTLIYLINFHYHAMHC